MASLAHEVVKNERPFRAPCFLFSAGETTTAIPDSSLIRGHGGPSQEMTAAFAVAAEGLKNVCLLSMDSEGTDGTTPVAGGLTDGTTGTAAAERGIDLRKALREHAAYEALEPLGIRCSPGTREPICAILMCCTSVHRSKEELL